MQHISDVVSQAVGANRPPHSPNQPDPEQFRAAAGVINRLFADLQALFPAWRQSYPGQADLAAAKRAWTRALVEAGVTTEEQLQWGLRRARRSGSPFWPSVGQFIQWCQPDPESLGLPSPEQAYREACAMAHPDADHSRWSHPAVRVAAREIGSQLPERERRKLFLRAYEIAVRRVANGEDLAAEISRGLPERPAPRPADPETARRHLRRMRQLLRA